MSNLILPSKIAWMVDLALPDEVLFSKKIRQRINQSGYSEIVKVEILPAPAIATNFLPIYERLLMSRPNYRLDKEAVGANIQRMSGDERYKLMWVTTSDNQVLGGIVFKLLPRIAKICYRAFDHDIEKSLDLKQLDYFAEIYLNNYFRQREILRVSHGKDKHPVTQIGLSIFKMRSGARPKVAAKAESLVFDETKWSQFVAQHELCGYYSDPDPVFYRKFHLFGDIQNELVDSFVKVAARVGVDIVTS